MPGMDLLCPKLRARLEGRPAPPAYPYDEKKDEKADYKSSGGMGVPIVKMVFKSDEEAVSYLKACMYFPRSKPA